MAKTAESNSTSIDTVKLAFAMLVLAGGVACYYWFSEFGLVYRVLMLVGSVAVAIGIAALSSQGRRFSHFMRAVRAELRRVIWPSRQETLQTTMIVMVIVVLVGLFLWLIDSVFNYGFLWIVGLDR